MDYYINACNPPRWASGVSYSANASRSPPMPDCVYNASDYSGYVCILDHTSSPRNRPPNTTYWQRSITNAYETLSGDMQRFREISAMATFYGVKYSMYEGGLNTAIDNGPANNKAFRLACLNASALTTVTLQSYTNFKNAGANTEFPSEYQLQNTTIWQLFPDLYGPGNARWAALLAWH
jgi:hypothetical protein